MSVLVRVAKHKAILRHGVWICAERGLEVTLNDATRQWIKDTGGPSLTESDQEGSVAREMVRRFGGSILLKASPRGRQSARFFLEQRQMELTFEGTIPLTRRRAV